MNEPILEAAVAVVPASSPAGTSSMYGSRTPFTDCPSKPFDFRLAAPPLTAMLNEDCLSKLTSEWSLSKYSANASAPLSATITGRAGYC